MHVPTAPLHRPRSNQTKLEATRPHEPPEKCAYASHCGLSSVPCEPDCTSRRGTAFCPTGPAIVRWSLMFIIPGRLHCFTHRQGSLPPARHSRIRDSHGKDDVMAAIYRDLSVLDPAKTGPELHFFVPLKQRQLRHNGCQPCRRRRSASRMLARSHPDQRMSLGEALLYRAPVPKPDPNSASA
jgi:hypothetical protein